MATNTALPMLELSGKYAVAVEPQKSLLAAAGEAMLAHGAHGSLGVFFGFILPTLPRSGMSLVMLQGRVFSRINSILGILGNALMWSILSWSPSRRPSSKWQCCSPCPAVCCSWSGWSC